MADLATCRETTAAAVDEGKIGKERRSWRTGQQLDQNGRHDLGL